MGRATTSPELRDCATELGGFLDGVSRKSTKSQKSKVHWDTILKQGDSGKRGRAFKLRARVGEAQVEVPDVTEAAIFSDFRVQFIRSSQLTFSSS